MSDKPEDVDAIIQQVFVSHSSQNQEIALQIVNHLESQGHECWIAPRDIPAGQEYNAQITAGIRRSDIVLLIESAYACDSEQVVREIDAAADLKLPVIPVRVEEYPRSGALEHLLRTYQWVNAFDASIDHYFDDVSDAIDSARGIAKERGKPDPTAIPKSIGPYRILDLVGEGGMGSVFKAEQRKPIKRTVALKRVKPGLDTKEILARFESERQALARMDHPNIAKVLDAGADDFGRPFFVMEYVPGQSITEFADENRLSIEDRLRLFVQVCQAVSHAHTKAIIHRDVKAGNVLAYSAEGKYSAKVIDFGIAKALTSDRLTDRSYATARGFAIGTYEYMSPEQAAGSADIDTRTDVYSLGVLLYELLSGAKPFDSDTLAKVADEEARRMIREDEPPKPSTKLSSLEESGSKAAEARATKVESLTNMLRSELEWIPLKAMRKERERRYDSPMDLVEDIENYLEGRPLKAGPESSAYRIRKSITRNRIPILASTAALVALIAGVAFYVLSIKAEQQRTANALDDVEEQRKFAISNANDAERRRKEAVAARNLADEQKQLAESRMYTSKLRLADTEWEHGDRSVAISVLKTCEMSMAGWEYGYLHQKFQSQIRNVLTPHADSILCLDFSPDRESIASGGDDNCVKISNIESGVVLHSLHGHSDFIFDVDFSTDGRLLASCGADKLIKIWDTSTGKEIRSLAGHSDKVSGVAFSNTGKLLASCGWDKTVRLWSVDTGELIRVFTGHTSSVNCVLFSPDSRSVASSGAKVHVWDVASGNETHQLSAGKLGVRCLAFDGSGTKIVGGSYDKCLYLWDLSGEEEPRKLSGHENFVMSVDFSNDGNRILSGGWDKSVRVWDYKYGEQALQLNGHTEVVSAVCFDGADNLIASAGEDKSIIIWNSDGERNSSVQLYGHQSMVSDIEFAKNGELMATCEVGTPRFRLKGDARASIRIWDMDTGAPQSIISSRRSLFDIALSPDGRFVAAVCDSETQVPNEQEGIYPSDVAVWDVSSGRLVQRLEGHSDHVQGVAFSPKGNLLASASSDKTVRIWDTAGGTCIAELAGHRARVWSVAFSHDGKRLASGDTNGAIRIWDAESKKRIHTLDSHKGAIYELAFGIGDTYLVSGCEDRTARLWDCSSGKQIHELRGHSYPIISVAFSPDGSRIVTGSQDKSIKIWFTESGEEIISLQGHELPVQSVAFSPDGKRLVSAGSDKKVLVWPSEDEGRLRLSAKGLADTYRYTIERANGIRFFGSKKYAEALPFLEQAAEHKEANASDLNLLGMCLGKLGRWDKAINAYAGAISRVSETSEAETIFLNTLEALVVAERPVEFRRIMAKARQRDWSELSVPDKKRFDVLLSGFSALMAAIEGSDTSPHEDDYRHILNGKAGFEVTGWSWQELEQWLETSQISKDAKKSAIAILSELKGEPIVE